MSNVCDVCGKKKFVGGTITRRGLAKKKGGIGLHCTGSSKRRFLPNLQSVRIKINNGVKRVNVCTSCIQKGLIQKA